MWARSSASIARSTCPATPSTSPEREFQHLEKRYFEVGNLGFPVWEALGGRVGMLICNDRRWPEAFRVLGLQGVELVLIGYNTPALNGLAFEPPHRRAFHNHLTMQAGAYQNGTWVVGVAKAGREEGVDMLGGSAIVSPNGEIVAQARSVDDEVVVAALPTSTTAPSSSRAPSTSRPTGAPSITA